MHHCKGSDLFLQGLQIIRIVSFMGSGIHRSDDGPKSWAETRHLCNKLRCA